MPDQFRDRVRDAKKPKYWNPKKEGEFITGKIKAFRAVTSRYGDGEVMEIVDDETKELTSVFLSTVIRSAREKQDLKVGERVGVKYLGEVSGENSEYKDFIITVDRKEPEGKE
jgi:hypothetical protein